MLDTPCLSYVYVSPRANIHTHTHKHRTIFDDPENPVRRAIMTVMLATSFDMFIALFIVLNVISMAVESFRQSESQIDFGFVANYFFTFVFGWECIFKLYGFYPRRYYSGGWNRFDYFIVMISFAGIAIDNLGTSVGLNPTVLRILRIFRIFRILRAFRIFKAAKGLQAIMATLANSLTALMNLFAMLGLVFFVFAVLGVTLYGGICTDEDPGKAGLAAVRCLYTDESLLLDRHASFKNIGLALLTLFRVATGDAWGELLAAAQVGMGPRVVDKSAWEDLVALLGYDPSLIIDKNSSDYFTMADSDASYKVLKLSINNWHSEVKGMEDDADWPFPSAAKTARSWVLLGRHVTPGCFDDGEVIQLERDGLLDCKTGDGYNKICLGTCGDSIVANIYFCLFVCIAAFVLLQLVIAVLMDQLSSCEDEQAGRHVLMPGVEVLRQDVFTRIYRRWRYNAARKLRLEKTLARMHVQGHTHSRAPSQSRPASRGRYHSDHRIHDDGSPAIAGELHVMPAAVVGPVPTGVVGKATVVISSVLPDSPSRRGSMTRLEAVDKQHQHDADYDAVVAHAGHFQYHSEGLRNMRDEGRDGHTEPLVGDMLPNVAAESNEEQCLDARPQHDHDAVRDAQPVHADMLQDTAVSGGAGAGYDSPSDGLPEADAVHGEPEDDFQPPSCSSPLTVSERDALTPRQDVIQPQNSSDDIEEILVPAVSPHSFPTSEEYDSARQQRQSPTLGLAWMNTAVNTAGDVLPGSVLDPRGSDGKGESNEGASGGPDVAPGVLR
jgi:hypothetical protein